MKDICGSVCEKNNCTACGACKEVCPVQCIDMKEDETGTIYSSIEKDKCVNCGLCSRVCHIVSSRGEFFNSPLKAFVGYAKENYIRENGASGGVASSLYLYAIENSYFIMGTRLDIEKGCSFDSVNSIEDIEWARNSKYVFSDMTNCYKEYEDHLRAGEKSIFIGLPCQTAAIKEYLSVKKVSVDNLTTVEVICHGVPNWKMLYEHLEYIKKKTKQKPGSVHFRERSDFFIICRNVKGDIVYKKPLQGSDEYFKGFSAGLILRNACYSCKYAQSQRQADITIGDFPGVGAKDDYCGEKKEISCILINSTKGLDLIDALGDAGKLFVEDRKVEEVMEDIGNPQLRRPMKRHCHQEQFVKLYGKTTFEKAVRTALRKEYVIFYIRFPFLQFKEFLRNHLSEKSIMRIKTILRRI